MDMGDAFWLAGRARCVKYDRRVVGGCMLRVFVFRTDLSEIRDQTLKTREPFIAIRQIKRFFEHIYNKNAFNRWRGLNRTDGGLEGVDRFPAACETIASKEGFRFYCVQSGSYRVDAIPAKNRDCDSPDPVYREQRNDRLNYHRKVNPDRVTFPDSICAERRSAFTHTL